MFSPYYAWSGRRRPLNHCAVNVALYSRSGARWAMTERGEHAVSRTRDRLRIGPSSLAWEDDALAISIDEVTAPIPRRVRGTVRVTTTGHPKRAFPLDAAGHHIWQPIAPRARVEVVLDQPNLIWRGDAYLDCNFGREPLEAGFSEWSWSRAHLASDTVVFYDALRRDGTTTPLAFRFRPDGTCLTVEPPPPVALPRTMWRLPRMTRADPGCAVSVSQGLEDGPFYARALLQTAIGGEPTLAMHESLSLDRFRSRLVQGMLPFRMPRRIF